MSAFSKIIAAAESCGLRAFPDVYEGKDLDRWVVYQYTTEYGDLYGDDAPEAITGTVQVKLILPEMENFLSIRDRFRQALFNQGFTFPRVTENFVDPDGPHKMRNIVFELEEDEMEE